MKLAGRDAARYFARPDPGRSGLLIWGEDAMRVALRRQEVIGALIGPEGEAEMRLTRIAGSDLRRDPALVSDAMRAQGFFPGPRVAFVEEASDAVAEPLAAALADWAEGDAAVVVTAGRLTAKSPLRKAFEGHRNAVSIGLFDDPPGREEIEATIAAAGLAGPPDAAMTGLVALARTLDPGDFRQTMEKIALYKHGDATPLQPEEIEACAPATVEAAIDDVIHCVAEGRAGDVGPLVQRLSGQGVQPVTMCIQAARHFRTLHAAACDPAGAASGLARARPPVFGPRRDRMRRQAQQWGVARLETALGLLTETDLSLRSSQAVPAMALMERALIRLARLAAR